MLNTFTLNNGQEMPKLGLGTWNSPKKEVGEAIKYAVLEAGYRHIDGAAIYGNEKEVGSAFDVVFKEIPRDEVFITSKLWNTEHKKEKVIKACKKTLKDLKIDYLDLYLIHWAIAFENGKDLEPLDSAGHVKTQNVSIRETWEAMEELVELGLVKSIGVANFNVTALLDILSYCKIKPVTNQIELHPYNAQIELLKYMKRMDILATAYSPLGTPGGLRKGEPVLLDDEVVVKLARKHKVTPAQLLLVWGMNRGTSVIPKSTNNKRIKENIESTKAEIPDDELKLLDKLDKNYRFVNPKDWWGIAYFE